VLSVASQTSAPAGIAYISRVTRSGFGLQPAGGCPKATVDQSWGSSPPQRGQRRASASPMRPPVRERKDPTVAAPVGCSSTYLRAVCRTGGRELRTGIDLDAPRHPGGPDRMSRAPASGRVLKINQDNAATVQYAVGRYRRALDVVADLLSPDAVQVTVGAPVRIDGWGGPPIEAR
jgi:hypothetical protein